MFLSPHFRIFALTALTVSLLGSSLHAGEWHRDFPEAERAALRDDAPLLIHFYADWCGPCRRMEREVLHNRNLTRMFDSDLVAVKINSDRHPALVKRFGVQALPTDLLLDPSGKEIYRSEGYRSRSTYVAALESAVGELSRTSAPRTDAIAVADPRRPDAQSGNDGSQSRESFDPASSTRTTTGKLLGLDGFSPVALWKWRQWKPGRPEFAVEFRGITYQLADAEEFAEFQKQPRRYAPRLLGCDPVILERTDRAITGSTQYGAYFDGSLYLFSTSENRSEFKREPLRFTRTRHALKAEEVVRNH